MESICKYNKPDCYGTKELDFLLELSSLLSNKDINLDEVIVVEPEASALDAANAVLSGVWNVPIAMKEPSP